MSIKIKRKEHKRNTPLWTFLGIAIIPLVLVFFAGFSSGRTEKVDQKNWKRMYEDTLDSLVITQAAMESIQADLENHDSFLIEINTLKEIIVEDGKNIISTLLTAYNTGNPLMINDWQVNSYLKTTRSWRTRMDLLELKYRKIIAVDSEKSFDLLESIINIQKEKIITYQAYEDIKLSDLKNTSNEELMQSLDKQQAELDAKQKEIQMQQKIDDLNRQLEVCKNSTFSQSSVLNENKTHTGTIESEIDEIRKYIIPVMQVKTLSNNKARIDRLKNDLEGRLTKIVETTAKIN